MRGSRKFIILSTLTTFFLVDDGREGPHTIITGPSSAHQRHRWRADDGRAFNVGSFLTFRGSGPVLLRNPIFFVIFRGSGGPDPLSVPLWIRPWPTYMDNCV